MQKLQVKFAQTLDCTKYRTYVCEAFIFRTGAGVSECFLSHGFGASARTQNKQGKLHSTTFK